MCIKPHHISPHYNQRFMGKPFNSLADVMPVRALVNAVLVAFLIVLLYLLYSRVQSVIGDEPWFVDSLGMHSPLVVFIGGVGFNLLAVVIDLSVLLALALVVKPSLNELRA